MSDGVVAKRGEEVFIISFRRLSGTIRVYVKAHPTLENLMKSWGSGVSGSIYDFGGRNWIFPPPGPEVWDISAIPVVNRQYQDGYYTLFTPGHELYQETQLNGLQGGLVNISYLRLVGISQGIEFELAGVHSVGWLQDCQRRSTAAVKRLYIDYLLPIDLTAQVVTQETRL